MGLATALFSPRPLGPLGGAKRSNIIKFQLLSQFQIFFNQTLCLLTNPRLKIYQMGFSFRRLDHAPGVGLGGNQGLKVNVFGKSIKSGV